ncbi:uncharacterized protein (DUF885 family) [Silvibacterium bohemicum]|uniref:Uncharacterized protein (DUF885 family) n=1 Tax=Silvibacterium bohemicum TaxID=1577686 RepID=A0A841K044_9BACT|nr:DUF885 domain-containing protein [Silvibacterium bohemicum]MBB6147113.1 uncharacterized protein (DUF885 family) [Silvibacterium bohemicum]
MQKSFAVAVVALVLPIASAHAQTFPKSVQKEAAQHSEEQKLGVPAAPTAAPALAPDASLEDRRKALNALFAEMWETRLRLDPEFASTIGDKRYNDQLTDYSVDAYNEELARGRDSIIRLGSIDTAGMDDQEILSKDLMIRQLVDQQAEAEFKPWEMPVNQFSGLHNELPQLVPRLSFETVKDYDDYTARLTKIPTAFDQISANMSTGIEDGRVPPKYLLEKVLVQVNAIATAKPEDTPFARPLQKFPSAISPEDQTRIKAAVLDAIQKQVLPAYAQFARFLKATYIPAGRTDPGVSSLSDGDKYYAFRVRESTTTDLTPAQIHQIGVDEVKRDEAEMLAIAQKLGFKDIAALRASINTNPKQHPQSKEQFLNTFRADIDQMRPKLPSLFGRLPKAPLEVEAVPEFIEKDQAPAYYDPGTPDGKRPGKVFVNTYDFEHRSLANVESIAYHEGIPGHHLQISIAQELTGIPEFRKYLGYTAFVEGWGLYAERLGKDVGFYQDPYSDYGRLETDIFRAIRLVVDTGVHSEHWSREQMVQYFHDHSGLDDATVQSEVDRYIAWPAQALGYKIGQLKILELRAKAQKELGSKFDLSAFHDQVIDSGALPLDVLEQRIDAWIVKVKSH